MIRLRDVSFYFPGNKDIPTLNSINLDIQDGEWIALTGRNGSGKSTLCRLIAGIERPSGGSIEVDGHGSRDAGLASAEGIAVGIAFQNPDSQFLASTVAREILFGLENLGASTGESETRMRWALEHFDLGDLAGRNPHMLSGGEKQRLLLACLWTMRPRHLVLDEPFSFLDASSRSAFLETVRERFHRDRITVIWSTLEPFEIGIADRVVYLDGGGIAFDGRPEDLRSVISDDVLAGPLPVSAAGSAVQGGDRVSGAGPAVVVSDASFRHREGDFELCVRELSLRPGETVGVRGPSGSGKSTLLLGCSGLLPPYSGDLLVLGKKIRSKRDFPAGHVALLFQLPEDGFFAPTVREEMALGYRSFHGATGELHAVSEALQAVGLAPDDFLHRNPFRLSQGEKRLVTIASLLVVPASLFLLDEPSLFLDGKARRLLSSALEKMKPHGATLMIASHEREFLCMHASRLISLERRATGHGYTAVEAETAGI